MSQITVTNIQGQTSGGNANKVIITSGHTLEVTSNSTVGGNSTITGSLTAPDIRGTTIKSSSGTNAMTIASGGQVTFATNPAGITSDLVKLLDVTISSPVAAYDITSTHINSTYDDYQLIANLHPASDGVHFEGRFFVGGVVDTGNNYGFETFPADGGSVGTADTASYMRFTKYTTGNDTGEGVFLNARITNVNSTNFPCCMEGQLNQQGTSGVHFFNMFGTSFHASSASKVVNGLKLFFGSGNIEFGNIKLFGIN